MTRLSTGHLFFVLFACFATGLAADAVHSTRDTADSDAPIGGFVPKTVPAFIGLVLFNISAVVQWFHYFTIHPRRPFMLTLTIGMTCMTLGFVLRIFYAHPPHTLTKYIATDMLILLSPCTFLATDYMLLSRLVATFDQVVADRCLLIRSTLIVKLFVWSDVITFLMQSMGGGLTAMKNATMANLGSKIAIVGLIIQAVSFLSFTCILLVFAWRVRSEFPAAWRPSNPRPYRLLSRDPIDDWRILFYVMSATCVGILIRSIFRISEYAGGYNGFIATHEGYFYLLDALPLWISMTLFCVVWPVRAMTVHPGSYKLSDAEGMRLAQTSYN